MAERAGGVTLAHSGRAEGQQVDGASEELAARQLAQLAPQRGGQGVVVEGLEGLAGWQLGSAAQTGDFALLARLGLHFQHLQHQTQRLMLAGLLQPPGQFGGRGASD